MSNKIAPQAFWLENLKQADRYNNWIFEQIQPHLGNNVLEVGCGNGNFTVFLAQQCDRVLAVDLDSEFIKLAKARLGDFPQVELMTADVTNWDTTTGDGDIDQKFDTIILLDVLEHIADDVAMLQKLFSLLQPQGKLILKVPALDSIYGEMDRAIGHYRRYNQETLAGKLAQAHISQSQTWYFNLAGVPGWWLNSKLLRRNTPPAAQIGLFNKLVPILCWSEKLVTLPLGLSLFAVAPKD